MKILLTLIFLHTLVFSLSMLPYQSLYSKLNLANTKLESLKNFNESDLDLAIKTYSNKFKSFNDYANQLLKKDNLEKQEQKEYLKKLRKLNSEYEKILYLTKSSLNKSIENENFTQFHKIIDANLDDIFKENAIKLKSINFYKKHKGKKYSKVLENEIKLQKEIEKTNKEEQKYLAQLEAQKNQTSQVIVQAPVSSKYKQTQTAPVDVKYLESSKLDSSKHSVREAKFTRWLSKREHQDRFDNGYYKKSNTYPAYMEMDNHGNRRVLEIPYEEKFYWQTTTGVSIKDFKRIHTHRILNGKKLLSLYIIKVNGIKFYCGTWVSEEQFAREANKLKVFGINPPLS